MESPLRILSQLPFILASNCPRVDQSLTILSLDVKPREGRWASAHASAVLEIEGVTFSLRGDLHYGKNYRN